MKLTALVGLLFVSIIVFGQNRKDWSELDFLNKGDDPFKAEQDISGKCFIILADTFDYHKRPIVIKSKDDKEIAKVEFSDTVITTTYRGRTYTDRDVKNPFSPWLFMNSSDYFQIAFECFDTTGLYYKVKIGTKDFAFIDKQNHAFKKQSPEVFVKRWTSNRLDFDRSKNPLRERYGNEGKIIDHADEKEYKIWPAESLETQGDWIKIKTIKNEIGWIRWRKGNKVLIRMYFAC